MTRTSLLLLIGCADGTLKGGELAPGGLTLDAPDGTVLDPKLDGEPALTLRLSVGAEAVGCQTSLRVENAVGQTRDLPNTADTDILWNGLDDEGVYFDAGLARLVAACDGVDAAALDLHLVRVGLSTIDFTAVPDDGNVPLAWHKRSLLVREVSALPAEIPEYINQVADAWTIADLDDQEGNPLPALEPWPDSAVAPWGELEPGEIAQNAPAAYVAGTRPALSVTGGQTAVSARSHTLMAPNPEALPLRLVLDGYSADDTPWEPDATVTLRADGPIDDTLGRTALELRWRWQADAGEGWVDLPGYQATNHDLWRLAGPTALRDGGDLGFAPAITWVAVLAELEEDLEGVPPEPAAVLDAVRDHLNGDRWLIYNPNDSAYSSYSGPYIYWDYIWSDLGVWLDRTEGIELYCHSVSCLLSTLSGHWGVEAPQQVLGVGFNTNYTRAAGTETWRTWSFNSHSVVSPDDGATIWDAAIDLDGDGSPGSQPNEALAPRGLPYQEYLDLLTSNDISIVNNGLCYFQ